MVYTTQQGKEGIGLNSQGPSGVNSHVELTRKMVLALITRILVSIIRKLRPPNPLERLNEICPSRALPSAQPSVPPWLEEGEE